MLPAEALVAVPLVSRLLHTLFQIFKAWCLKAAARRQRRAAERQRRSDARKREFQGDVLKKEGRKRAAKKKMSLIEVSRSP